MIPRLPVLVLASGAVLTGCTRDAVDGPNLLVPDDVEVRWSRAFDPTNDGIAALVPVDFMVYDAQSGEPMGDVPLVVRAEDDAALVATPGEIDLAPVTPPGDLAGECLDCAPLWWDAWRDQYFAFAEGAEPSAVLAIDTDPTGLARAYVFVDTFTAAQGGAVGGAPGPVLMTVSIGSPSAARAPSEPIEETFLLLPR